MIREQKRKINEIDIQDNDEDPDDEDVVEDDIGE